MDKTIEELDLTVRAYNSLKRFGINDVSSLTVMTEDDLLKIRNMGRASLENIISELDKLGLSLKAQ